MVELELKMELRDDVRAANITDIINPRNPLGTYSVTNFMNAKFVHPYLSSERLEKIDRYSSCKFYGISIHRLITNICIP